MTKNILKLTATFLGLDDVNTYLADTTQTPSSEVTKTINELIVFTNYVMREITREYYPLKTTETVVSNENKIIAFSTLSKTITVISDVKNCTGLSVKYALYPDHIEVGNANQEYTLFYSYCPNAISTLQDTLKLPLGLDYFIVCFGVASEYCLAKGLYEEAAMWENRFINSLKNVNGKTGEKRFKARRLK